MRHNLIQIVSKVVFLALWRGRGVEFGLKLCNVIYEWPLMYSKLYFKIAKKDCFEIAITISSVF